MATKNRKRAKLPQHVALDPEKQKEFKQNTKKIKQKAFEEKIGGSGVVQVSHLPHGFVEEPLREFFKQFGRIKQLRVSRSKKTGNSKGFAFIEFVNDDVARIAADTMNNYLMFNKLLKCRHVDKPHPDTFKHANRTFNKPVGPVKAIRERNKPGSQTTAVVRARKAGLKLGKMKKKLAELGIDYSVEIKGAPTKLETENDSADESDENGEVLKPKTKQSPSVKGKKGKNKVDQSKVVEIDNESSSEDDVEEIKEEDVSDEEPSPKKGKQKVKVTPKRQKQQVKGKSPALPVEEIKEEIPDEGEVSFTNTKQKLKNTPRKRKTSKEVTEMKEEEESSPKQPKRILRGTPSRQRVQKLKS